MHNFVLFPIQYTKSPTGFGTIESSKSLAAAGIFTVDKLTRGDVLVYSDHSMKSFFNAVLSDQQSGVLREDLEQFHTNVYTQNYSSQGYLMERERLVNSTPDFLKEVLNFYLHNNSLLDALVLQNCPVDSKLGKTPTDSFVPSHKSSQISERLLLKVCSLLGAPFAIDAENNGFMVHNIYPVKQMARTQSSKSSEVNLSLHTELSCIDHPPEFLILLGLRESTYEVATPIVKLDEILEHLNSEEKAILSKPLFTTEIDESLRDAQENGNFSTKPFALTVNEGGVNVWRYDVEYTRGTNSESQAVAKKVAAISEKLLFDIIIKPGDLVVLDNTKVAHSRKPFTAKYDGSDRWIQRINAYKRAQGKTHFTVEELLK